MNEAGIIIFIHHNPPRLTERGLYTSVVVGVGAPLATAAIKHYLPEIVMDSVIIRAITGIYSFPVLAMLFAIELLEVEKDVAIKLIGLLGLLGGVQFLVLLEAVWQAYSQGQFGY